MTIILAGVALLFLFQALVSLVQSMASRDAANAITFWMFGSLNRTEWTDLGIMAVVLLAVCIFFAGNLWRLTALRMGDSKAQSLGVNVSKLRRETLIGVSVLTATVVSFTGTIGFIGLVGPHSRLQDKRLPRNGADRRNDLSGRGPVLHIHDTKGQEDDILRLEVGDVRFAYGDREILKGVGFSMGSGVMTILGPNGAGKSTLVKCLAGVHAPHSGHATFDGRDLLGSRDPDETRIAYMSQEQPNITNMSVMEVMLLGLVNRLSFKVTDDDLDRAYAPLEELHLEELADMPMNHLSGGQCQMVLIAQCLVSEPELIILDEPMNNLDLRRELEMFDTMSRVTRARGLTTLMVLHDINSAARYSDSILVLKDGQVYADGPPADVVTPETIRDVYGVEAEVDRDRRGNVRIDPCRAIER